MTDVKIIADLQEIEQSRVAVIEDGKLAEIFIEFNDIDNRSSIREGDVFKAKVETLVPAISAAFVRLSSKNDKTLKGAGNAFMYTPSSVKPGQELIVQVEKTARKNKAPRVTPQVSLPGRWLVLVPNSNETGVSKKIDDLAERKRLKSLAETFTKELDTHGVIIRTAAEGVSEELLRRDLDSLLELWRNISEKADSNSSPCLLYRDMGILGRVLRDEVCGKVSQIIINEPCEFQSAKRCCFLRQHNAIVRLLRN